MERQPIQQRDIDNYISSKAEESINLEFKRGDALRTDDKTKAEIAKDISAFANSDGGIIIYGIEERDHKAAGLVFVNGNDFTKEWLEQVINSRIHRKIEGIIIEPIRYDDKIEQTVYVVTIPRSINAPHMASEKFYKRYNFQAIVMEEYEVRNLYSRQDKTELELVPPKFTPSPRGTHAGKLNQLQLEIEFNVLNKGRTIEKLYKLDLHIPKVFMSDPLLSVKDSFFKYKIKEENDYLLFAIPSGVPLYQNELATIGIARLMITYENFAYLETSPINLTLRYSNGIEEKSVLAIEQFTYKSRRLILEDFSY